jgi:hypothetical protein
MGQFNRMTINWNKTKFMILTKQHLVSLSITICIDSVNIVVVGSFKLLDVIIDRKLDFHNHVDVLKILVNRKLLSSLFSLILFYLNVF